MSFVVQGIWERRSNPEFWWLLGLLLVGVLLLGGKLFLQHTAQAREQREEEQRQKED